jgi:hypothetical protein
MERTAYAADRLPNGGWIKRSDGTVWRAINEDVYARALKDGFVPTEAPTIVTQHLPAPADGSLATALGQQQGVPTAPALTEAVTPAEASAAPPGVPIADVVAMRAEYDQTIAVLKAELEQQRERDDLHARNTQARKAFGGPGSGSTGHR